VLSLFYCLELRTENPRVGSSILPLARTTIADWRQDCNEVRPHSSCKRMPPAKFAALHRQQKNEANQQQPTEEIS
jgi:transposase InsO family protein